MTLHKSHTTVNYIIAPYDSWMNPRTDVITYSAPFSSWGWCYRSTDQRRWILEYSQISLLRELDCYVAHTKRLWCTIIVKSLLLWAVLMMINKAQKTIAWNEWLGLLLPHPTVKRTSRVIALDLHSPWFQQAQLCKEPSLLHFSHVEPGAYRGWLVWTRSPSSNWKSQNPRSCQSWLKDFILHAYCFQHKRNQLCPLGFTKNSPIFHWVNPFWTLSTKKL